jgi:hypothetical protein
MQCILCKIYFWNVFHKYYNLICIFICTHICTKFFILVKSGCYIPLRLSSCQSMNSPVGVNPHGSVEKVKLLLNSSHLEPQAVKLPRHCGDDDSE